MKRIIHLLLIAGIFAFAPSCKKEGCMDSKAINFDSKAKKDDGSCEFPPKDTTVIIDTIDKDTPQIKLLRRGNCPDCIVSSGFHSTIENLRFDLNVTYDKPLKNVKFVRNRVGIGTVTLLDTNITGMSLDAVFNITGTNNLMKEGEKSIFTITATGANDKVGILTITITGGTGELNERINSLIHQGNPDGDNKPHSFDLATGLHAYKFNDNKIKDINEPSTSAFLKKFNSLNGSKFKKYSGGSFWDGFKTQADLEKAWTESGAELSEIALQEDLMFLVKSTQNGYTYVIYINEIYDGVIPGEIKINVKGQF